MTPYDHWRRAHAIHHATSGNLDQRGIGDIDTLTVREYLAGGRWARLRYRLYRHPAVMFGVGPFFLFVLENRLPFGFMRKGRAPWVSTMATNAGILVAGAFLIWAVGAAPFLLVHLPIVVVAATTEVLALLRPASVRADLLGRGRRPGTCRKRRCMAARITTFPRS